MKMPVDRAAQDVQHSADGSAYEQWVEVATLLAGYFTGVSPGGVSCWYSAGGKPDLAGALKQLTETFGPQGTDGMLVGITTDRSAKKTKVAVVHVQRDGAWTVAGWLVAHAQQYGISQIRYAGFVWDAGNGSMGWQRVPGSSRTASPTPRGSIVAA
jgi:predicted peptidase